MVKKKKKNALELWSIFKERLSPTDLKTLTSLLIDSNRRRIDKTQLIASALVLFKKDEFLHRCFTDFLNKPQEEDEEEDEDKALKLVKDVTHGLDKMDLGGKKRRLLQTTERSLKKARTSSRQLERVTPSYKLIPEEEQCPVSNKVLNNKYAVMQFKGASRRKKLSKYEEAVARCEEDMFESDMLMEALKSAVESAEQVIKEEMSVENLGVKFYRCIERLYRGDMFAVVREDHKKVLPVILIRLKQKLDAVRVAREIWIPMWKQVFEDNTIKQRESTTFRRR
ncbi:BnaCnng44190D [Brassica napus]|uniref:BnaCnng44190D protein n=1 Tax=Brassica napus TaxID=3708 RepID=A0A078JDS7_BRANA|nr:BnaCnng44190D [Brassica napus]